MWQVNELFENREYYLQRFNKKEYPDSFDEYEKIFCVFDKVCMKYYESCGDVNKLCDEVSNAIVMYADELKMQHKFKNASQESIWQEQLNLFVVTYLLPAVLECRNAYYKLLAMSIEQKWEKAFPGYPVKAGTFETLNSGFKKKMFGLF